MVLAGSQPTITVEHTDLDDEPSEKQSKSTVVESKTKTKPVPTKEVDFEDDDESLSYFAKLASED